MLQPRRRRGESRGRWGRQDAAVPRPPLQLLPPRPPSQPATAKASMGL